MIKIKNITIRNFLSVGNVDQAIAFDNNDLTLILGENLDLGGNDNRNGCGKSTIIQAISYALFDAPISSIRKDNLINRTNTKGMLVVIEFEVNGKTYKIERGRKPNILRLYVDSVQKKAQGAEAESESQGENKQTQAEIERILNMSHDMFKHIVALNTYTDPFLSMKAADQRTIIEQLLGITLLSEKAEKLKAMAKETKDAIQLEDFRIKAIEEANKKVTEQIESLERRQKAWNAKFHDDVNMFQNSYNKLCALDVDKEIEQHTALVSWTEQKKQNDSIALVKTRYLAWDTTHQEELAELKNVLEELSKIDTTMELEAHKQLKVYNETKKIIENLQSQVKTAQLSVKRDEQVVAKLETEIQKLKENKCYACGQDIHDEHADILVEKQKQLDSITSDLTQTKSFIFESENKIQTLNQELGTKPETIFESEHQVAAVVAEIENTKKQITTKESQTNPFNDDYVALGEIIELGEKPITHYATVQEAYEHKSKTDTAYKQLQQKLLETDPYVEQLEEMKTNAIQEISFEKINELSKHHDHLKFLSDLLLNKDSFVRKKIIDQNLSYLNSRLTYYLEKIGLPHEVVFKNDLSVEITELGRELDFGNLSRGESNRLILGLSWAFRDVWESLYTPINVMFIDELLDNGTDSAGVENSLGILKEMNRARSKSIWLISHKDDLVSRVNNVLKVVKENGFTSFESTTETI